MNYPNVIQIRNRFSLRHRWWRFSRRVEWRVVGGGLIAGAAAGFFIAMILVALGSRH